MTNSTMIATGCLGETSTSGTDILAPAMAGFGSQERQDQGSTMAMGPEPGKDSKQSGDTGKASISNEAAQSGSNSDADAAAAVAAAVAAATVSTGLVTDSVADPEPSKAPKAVQNPKKTDEQSTKVGDTGNKKEPPLDICPVTKRPHAILEEFQVTKCPCCKEILSTWCQEARANHSVLREFDITDCPRCGKFLVDTSATDEQHTRKGPDGQAKEGDGAGSGSGAGGTIAPGESEVEITHSIEYWDKGGSLISMEEWPRPFNLQEERTKMRQARGQQTTASKFQLISVLDTSVAPEQNRFSYGKYSIHEIVRGGVVHNPDIAVVVRTTKLVIQSLPFINALKSILKYDPVPALEVEKLVVEEPFALIAHHLSELKALKHHLEGTKDAVSDPDRRSLQDKTASDINVALRFMGSVIEERMIEEEGLYARPEPACTFRMLWLLFKPGTIVYSRFEGRGGPTDAFVVLLVQPGPGVLCASTDDMKDCTIVLWYLDYDGNSNSVSRFRHTVVIPAFSGEKLVASLDVVPSDIWDRNDGGKLREKLGQEGRKWFSLLSGQQVQYKGNFVGGRGNSFDGRAFVDPASWYEVNAYKCPLRNRKREANSREPDDGGDPMHVGPYGRVMCNCSACTIKRLKIVREARPLYSNRWATFDDVEMGDVKEMNKNLERDAESLGLRYLLASKRLKGFVFNTRTWETLHVAYCQKPKPNRVPFERLVMPEERKLMIKSLVYKYTDRTTKVWSSDYIQNKGNGQIFLLHGAPGVGKTFTAECIAEFTGQPLLALTCGDIGTDEVEMEAKLGKWLKLGHRWAAVMLIDEADVFLEKRQQADLKRNSLVSVFLREVEYYRGILFLTTNRVGQFDDAFISRIHIVIHYENLTSKDRDRIWKQFFDKLEEEKEGEIKVQRAAKRYVLEDEEITSVKWNGREIRNAFQTAVALAEYRFLTRPENEKAEGDTAELTEDDFRQVCGMTKAFKQYLTDVNNNYDESQRAANARLRRGSNSGM